MNAYVINQKIVILEPLQKYGLVGLEPCKERRDFLAAKSELTASEQTEFTELNFALDRIEMLEG